jgi:hypothetical protein
MSELDYEQRMAADQPRLSLREAAQALLDAYVADIERWMTPYWDALRDALRDDVLNEMSALTASEYQELSALTKTHQQLDEALEYELIGTIDGTYGGRWVLWNENAAAVWPDNTAVYVKRGKK